MEFLLWFDDSKKPAITKLSDACRAYEARYGYWPTVAKVSEADKEARAAGVSVYVETYVRPNNFWVGKEG